MVSQMMETARPAQTHLLGSHSDPLSAVGLTCLLSTLMGTCHMTSARMNPPWMSSRPAWHTKARGSSMLYRGHSAANMVSMDGNGWLCTCQPRA